MKNAKLYLPLILMILYIESCGIRGGGDHPTVISDNIEGDIEGDIEGEYVFKYPSGQIETVIIKSDSSYKQIIYSDEISYKKNDSCLFNNSGTWILLGKEINFNNWLMYNYLRNPDSILVSPYKTTLVNVYWYNDREIPVLSVFPDNGYVFKKVN